MNPIDTKALRDALERRARAIDTALTDINAPEKQIEAEAEILDAAPALLDAAEEVKRLEAENDRLRSERSAALNVKTTDGLTSSEWILRTGLAERERDALRSEVERLREALTPSEETRHAYSNFLYQVETEFRNGAWVPIKKPLPWGTIKSVLEAVAHRAALRSAKGEVRS
jgi:hypothetical protein